MDSKKIGAFIQEKRNEKKMTQEDLASIIYVSNKTISKWETGKGIPSIDLIIPLSKALDVTLSELLSGEENASSEEILVKELQKKKKRNIINFILGLFTCFFLCFLETILYIAKIEAKYAYIIFGIFIVFLLIIDITNYFLNK